MASNKVIKYVVSIAFNYGRDEASRIVRSVHRKPQAAIAAWEKSRNNNGWSPRIACSDDSAAAELRNAAPQWAADHADYAVVVVAA